MVKFSVVQCAANHYQSDRTLKRNGLLRRLSPAARAPNPMINIGLPTTGIIIPAGISRVVIYVMYVRVRSVNWAGVTIGSWERIRVGRGKVPSDGFEGC